jgi:hypothetical protein
LSFLALRQNLDKNPNQFLPYSNNLADFYNVNKEFLPKNPPKNPPKKFSKDSQKFPQKYSKKFLPKKIPKNFQNNQKKSIKCPNNFSKNS